MLKKVAGRVGHGASQRQGPPWPSFLLVQLRADTPEREGNTPMEAGVTNYIWTLEEILRDR